jgi:UDP-N-acetylmuramate: L-alanyl-gamma-D-glutamyl-meso-diaminopimelate ligase
MKTHFISIGGSVMHQLAIALKHKGYSVTGSDDDIFEPSRTNLEKEGLLPQKMGWDVENISTDLDAVILGMHAREDNPELLKAKALGLKIYSFPEYIYQESRNKIRVAVGGSHGKTTTTSMIMHVLRETGKDFDYLVGAKLDGFAQSVQITDAPIIVCEADEYPASALEKRPKFHFLFPNIAILTGIAWDHINVFPTFEFYLEQFKIFIDKIEPNGLLIYNEQDKVLKKLVNANKRKDIVYQPYNLPSYTISHGVTKLNINGLSSEIKVFGHHNLLNIQAAYFACKKLGVDSKSFLDAISSFTGAANRLEVLAQTSNCTIFRDFAHAPSKVKATIDAVKAQFPKRRLIAVLELHTYSSLNAAFMPQYKGVLNPADDACVFYSHHAMEIKKMSNLPRDVVMSGFEKDGLFIINTRETLDLWLAERDYEKANLLLMSSGNFDGLDLKKVVEVVNK